MRSILPRLAPGTESPPRQLSPAAVLLHSLAAEADGALANLCAVCERLGQRTGADLEPVLELAWEIRAGIDDLHDHIDAAQLPEGGAA